MADLRCVGCGRSWRSLQEFIDRGGKYLVVGDIGRKCECPNCRECFPPGQAWKRRELIDLRGGYAKEN